MKECDLDIMLARAQIGGFFLMLCGIFGLVFSLIFFHESMDDKTVTIVTSGIGVMLTILTLMANYMYARQRPHTPIDPPPDNTAVTTSTTVASTTTPLVPTENKV